MGSKAMTVVNPVLINLDMIWGYTSIPSSITHERAQVSPYDGSLASPADISSEDIVELRDVLRPVTLCPNCWAVHPLQLR